MKTSDYTQRRDEKECRMCHEVKPLSEYYPYKKIEPEKRVARCKECHRNYFTQVTYPRSKESVLARNKRWGEANQDRVRELTYARYDPFKQKARAAINNEIARGKLVRGSCTKCGEPKTDFHHTNGYDKPNWFVGVWLCRKHHGGLHREQRLAKQRNIIKGDTE